MLCGGTVKAMRSSRRRHHVSSPLAPRSKRRGMRPIDGPDRVRMGLHEANDVALATQRVEAAEAGGVALLVGHSRTDLCIVTQARLCTLGRVDGFDDDEAQSECDEGSEVPVRFLATERNALEALELADEVFDAGAGAIERLREEGRPVLGR